MATTSHVLGGSSAPLEAVIGGKTYKISPFTQIVKSKLERVLQERARTQVMADKDNLSDEEFKIAYGVLLDRISTGTYSFAGTLSQEFLSTPLGSIHMVAVLFNIAIAEAEELILKHDTEVSGLINQMVVESFPQAPSQQGIPKAPGRRSGKKNISGATEGS